MRLNSCGSQAFSLFSLKWLIGQRALALSKLVFTTILNDVLSGIDFRVVLDESDRAQLYQEVLYFFGLVGATNVCEALDVAWRDSYNQNEIREFILAWLRKKAKKEVRATGVI